MTIEVKELVVRFTVNESTKSNSKVNDKIDEQKIRMLINSQLEEFLEKLDRRENR